MYQKVKAYIKEHGMIEAGDVVFAGVSGGGDSMAMLTLLKRYQTEMPFSLCAVHIHHGIRGDFAWGKRTAWNVRTKFQRG